jgi:nicotinamidase-related amidase
VSAGIGSPRIVPAKTALVLVDLMVRIIQQPTYPHVGTTVLARSAALVRAARRAGVWVALVRTERPGDIEVVKRTWGAFHGTMLDRDLHAVGVSTVWLCGISTNHGVESTARAANDLGYDVVFVEDCMAGLGPGQHDFAVREIFPSLGAVTSGRRLIRGLRRA